MLYVCEERSYSRYAICDSCTDEIFNITRIKDKGYCGNNQYDLTHIVGFLASNNRMYAVPKELINLLWYISHIDAESALIDDKWKGGMRVCKYGYEDISDNNLILKAGLKGACNILDIVLCATYDESFPEWLDKGVLPCNFGDKNYLIVYLCGNYKAYIGKLVALYRGSWEEGDGAGVLLGRDI